MTENFELYSIYQVAESAITRVGYVWHRVYVVYFCFV